MTPQQQDLIDEMTRALGLAEIGLPRFAAASFGDVKRMLFRATIALSNAYHEIDSLNQVIAGFDHVTKALAEKNATIDRLQEEIDTMRKDAAGDVWERDTHN